MSAPAVTRLLWSWAGLPHLLLVVLPLAALDVQMRYRIPSRYVSWLLPWIGVALSGLSLLFFLNRLITRSGGADLRATLERFERWSFGTSLAFLALGFMSPGWLGSPWLFPIFLWGGFGTASAALIVHACHVTVTTLSGSLQSSFRWLERVTLLLIVVFVGYGAVALANGALDFSAPAETKSQIITIEGAEVDLGRFVSVSWADLRSWRAEGLERIFLHEHERRRTWPGQAVLVSVHRGALGIPWVSRVTRDDEAHYRKLLEAVPTATGPRKHLISFYLDRQRWEDATAVALEYLKLYPDDYDYIGDIATRLGAARRTKESLALLEPLADRLPPEPESWWAAEVQQRLHQLRRRLGQPGQTATR